MQEIVSKNKTLLNEIIPRDKYARILYNLMVLVQRETATPKLLYFAWENRILTSRSYFWFKINGIPAYSPLNALTSLGILETLIAVCPVVFENLAETYVFVTVF